MTAIVHHGNISYKKHKMMTFSPNYVNMYVYMYIEYPRLCVCECVGGGGGGVCKTGLYSKDIDVRLLMLFSV